MSTLTRWTFRSLAIVSCTALVASVAHGQIIIQPKANPGGAPVPKAEQPKNIPTKNPFAPIPLQTAQPLSNLKKPSILSMPSINSWTGIPMNPIHAQSIPALWNPVLNNPWMNQLNVHRIPVSPWAYPFANIPNPAVANPLLVNPVQNPFVINPWDNPLLVNPLLANSLVLNPFLVNRPLRLPFDPPNMFGGHNWRSYPSASQPTYSPPLAVQEPGVLMYQGPDLQVNNTSGSVYQPISGVVTLADGSTFYRDPGTGMSEPIGNYMIGSADYANPLAGNFFSPSSGKIGRPTPTNVFMPYVW